MPKKIHHITLNDSDYDYLQRYVQGGHQAARAINRARILLFADLGMTDEDIAATLSLSMATVYRVRKNYHAFGLPRALDEHSRRGAPPKLDGRAEATLTMLACSTPPEGSGRWTLQLLADKLVELEVVTSISVPTVRTALKKTNSSPGWSNAGASARSRETTSGTGKIS
jgi:transposase